MDVVGSLVVEGVEVILTMIAEIDQMAIPAGPHSATTMKIATRQVEAVAAEGCPVVGLPDTSAEIEVGSTRQIDKVHVVSFTHPYRLAGPQSNLFLQTMVETNSNRTRAEAHPRLQQPQ